MPVGLEALKIFQAVGTVKMREKYPSIFRTDVDEQSPFNPNSRYTYNDTSVSEKITHTSPFFCFTLIPETTTDGDSSLDASLYLLQFLNWAIYFYNTLYYDYNSLPTNRPKKDEILKVQWQTQVHADMIESITGKHYSEDELQEKTNRAFKKNNFVLKPDYFLKLCRFFARGWYEERFCTEDDKVGSVEFAHYISNYIEGSLISDGQYSFERYNGNNKNHKKEVSHLFDNDTKIEYVYRHFQILLEKIDNNDNDPTYTISVNQHSRHTFYLYSRLFLDRYTSEFK